MVFDAELGQVVVYQNVVDKIVNQDYNNCMNEENFKKTNTNKYSKYESVLETGLQVINFYNELERTPKSYGTEEIYYSLEIHTIHAIGKNSEMNVTEIADWHGISKSAISKVLNKLEKKNAVYRYKALNNKKEVLFGLTEEGKKAFQGHIEYHLRFQSEIFEKFDKISYEKLKNFEEVMLIFMEFAKKHN